MGISSFADLRQWFFAGVRQKGEGAVEAAPHWNLYAGDYGMKEVRIMSNNRISDMDESYSFLENTIRAQNNPEGARFRIQTYAPGKANNPTAETYVQIYEKSQAPATAPAGIAGLPTGVGSIQEYVNDKLETERLKWKIEQLESQINAPSNGFERFMETLAVIPGIDGVMKAAVIGLVTKFNPAAMPAIQAAMNGTPSTAQGEHEADNDADPNAVFIANIQEAAAALSTDPVTMAKRLNQLMKSQPEIAKQLMQQ